MFSCTGRGGPWCRTWRRAGSRKDERHVPGRVWLAVPQLAEGTTLRRACPESCHDQTRTALTIDYQTSGSARMLWRTLKGIK